MAKIYKPADDELKEFESFIVYTYRGESVTSDSVKSKEEQMKKSLAK